MKTTFAPFRYPHLFKLWSDWQPNIQNQQLDKWLKQWFKAHKQYGKRDRLAYSDALFAAMRYLQLACALDESYHKNASPDWLDWDKSWQNNQTQSIASADFWYWVLLIVNQDQAAPKELNDANKRLAHFITFKEQALTDKDSLEYLLLNGLRPQWQNVLHQRQQRSAWNSHTLYKFIEQQNSTAPLWLRPQQKTAKTLITQLAAEGIETEQYENSLRVLNKANISNCQSYQRGLIEIQDLASQQLAQQVKVKPGDSIWDVCAGAGGKTLAIANKIDDSNTLIATDNREHALKALHTRAKRAGFKPISTHVIDASKNLELPPAMQNQNGFNWVLIDAPCSSSGTWRRNPDSRWRLTSLNELLSLQQAILNNAAQYVKPGGHLVYATCSWLAEENEIQIEQFLKINTQFTLKEQYCIGNPEQDADTMFYGLLQRHT